MADLRHILASEPASLTAQAKGEGRPSGCSAAPLPRALQGPTMAAKPSLNARNNLHVIVTNRTSCCTKKAIIIIRDRRNGKHQKV